MAYRDSPLMTLLLIISTIFPVLVLAEKTYCYTSFGAHGVESHHCEKAIEKIIYDSNQTLDNVSGSLTVSHKTCVVNIQKPKRATPTRTEIDTVVHNVTRSCPATGGVLVNPSLLTIIYRSNNHNTYVTNRPKCGKSICGFSTKDCVDAFQSLPVNKNGFFTAQETSYSSANATQGSCMVKISATDYAPFRTSHAEIGPYFEALMNECQEHPGTMFINGGTAGYNGDVRISYLAAPNARCL